ncbi:MAG: LysM peptidoglycan-binding domain-containing protein [Rhodothermales bacterium]|nr:LysM peptidoglycan-binding domain-containing protein [Rhodothermales bacterium]
MNSTPLSTSLAMILLVGSLIVNGSIVGEASAQNYKTHTVKSGDTLYRIARQNYVTVQSLRQLNRISDDVIKPGQILWIDGRPPEDSLAASTADSMLASESIPVVDALDTLSVSGDEPRDTLLTDAIVIDSIAAERDSLIGNNDTQLPTEPLTDEASRESPAPAELFAHLAEPGETLFDIADRYGVSADTLVLVNPMHPTFFTAGDTVMVPWGTRFGKHRVRSGETLFRISRSYGTSVKRVQELNSITGSNINVGQQLIVPIRPSEAETHLEVGPVIVGQGVIGTYPEMFEGRLMANGQPYLPEKFTVSHGELPFGTIVQLIDPASGRQTFAEVTDRLPAGSDVIMEVSQAVALVLNLADPTSPVEVRRLR